MIGTRIGVALALVLSIAALGVGVAALMGTIRDNGAPGGRLVQTRITNELTGDPVEFAADGFFMTSDGSGRVAALYAYPPGYFGDVRGCKLVWQPLAVVSSASGTAGPGLFTDPCSGARFDRTGTLVTGPADRNLDRFPMTPEPDGFLVDTRTLLCGANLPVADAADAPTATPTPETPATCARVSPDAAP
ncbi:MAG: hypothetical protein IVW36_09520 [Dehalococcoidia bacterium]|nr:hypothetical protein [Dehalococcoidia bacterium]